MKCPQKTIPLKLNVIGGWVEFSARPRVNSAMFGTYRYILAVMVVISHLSGVTLLGWLAVHGFFCLSGYLMTTIMHRDYGYTASGISRFALNRVLRLFPIYWCILILAVLIIWYFRPETAQLFHGQLTLPKNAADVLANITLIYPGFFPGNYGVKLSPPSWALTIELLFYAFIALGLSRSKRITGIWFALAIIYFAVTHIMDLGPRWRYSMLLAGALPFSVGALIYHYKAAVTELCPALRSPAATIWLIIALGLNALFCLVFSNETPGLFFHLTFYANIGLSAALIFNLEAKGGAPKRGERWARLDRVLGQHSYPLYLMHFPVAFALSMIILGRAERIYDTQTPLLLALTLAVSFVISQCLIYTVDRPIQKLRTRIRRG